MPRPMVQVALIQPQIPPNTGNIARTCAATETPLHLVGPLGFELSDRYLKRAGLDYWPHVDLHCHDSIAAFVQQCPAKQEQRWVGFSTKGTQNYIDFDFRATDILLFGRETSGLPQASLDHCTDLVYIPMSQAHVRSLNLSVSVAIALFEARRQLGQLKSDRLKTIEK